MRNFLPVVPARAGSVGVPRKNLSVIGGLTLVSRAFGHATYMASDCPPLLSTDSQEIVNSVLNTFSLKPFDLSSLAPGEVAVEEDFLLHHRPHQLADSKAKISDVLFYLREKLDIRGLNFRAWMLVQPTTPFRSKVELNEFSRLASEATTRTSIVSVRDVDDAHPARMYFLDGRGLLKPVGDFGALETSNRQDLPRVFLRDGGFYIIGDDLVEERKQVGPQPIGIVRSFPYSLNIDRPEDLLLAQSLELPEGEGTLKNEQFQ